MNYQKTYESIINAAKKGNRKQFKKNHLNYVYYENHHIIPKCLDGNDDEQNLVLLTAKEHYLCHKLLTYIYPKNYKIVCAFNLMTFDKQGRHNISSRDYAYARELFSLTPMPQEIRDKIGNKIRGIIRSEEFKQKNRNSHQGTNSGEKCNFIKYIAENRKGKTLKEEMLRIYGEEQGIIKYNQWITNMKNAKLGTSLSTEHKENISKSGFGLKRSEKAKENIKLGWIKRKEKQQLKLIKNDS